jgi:uncharacterized protein
MKRLCAVLVMLVVWPVWADYQDGLDAWQRSDYAMALKEWRPLADQGLADAQASLGWLYFEGFGVPQDYLQAHMWLNLAAAQGNERGRMNRDMVAAKMTPSQIEEAQRLAREWLAAHP